MADEREDEKPEGEAPGEEAAESSQETAVGHKVVDPDAASDTGATEVFFSRDEPEPPQPAAAPAPEPSGTSPAAADREAADAQGGFQQKPELFVVGAFVGAFVLGKVLKKLTGSDD